MQNTNKHQEVSQQPTKKTTKFQPKTPFPKLVPEQIHQNKNDRLDLLFTMALTAHHGNAVKPKKNDKTRKNRKHAKTACAHLLVTPNNSPTNFKPAVNRQTGFRRRTHRALSESFSDHRSREQLRSEAIALKRKTNKQTNKQTN